MIGMAFLGLLILYTIFVLAARRAATKIWRLAHEQGIGALVIRVPRLRDVGWGAALVPVTTSFLVLSGTFGITNVGGTGRDRKSVV